MASLLQLQQKYQIQENITDSIINKLENLTYEISNLKEENKTLYLLYFIYKLFINNHNV